MTYIKHLATLTLALASTALAAGPAKPRVLVIVDTSKSMEGLTQADIVAGKGNIGTTVKQTNTSGPLGFGDYDPETNPLQDCGNKFCSAKKVVYNTLPNYAEDAVIGVTSYYQYLFRKDPIDFRRTTCSYDVLIPAGLPRQFSSSADLTGGAGSDIGATSPNRFPDNLAGRCRNLAASTGTLGTRYTVTKTAAVPGATNSCNVYSAVGIPRNFGATPPTGCTGSVAYTTLLPATTVLGGAPNPVGTASGFFEQSLGAGGTGPCNNITATTTTPAWAAGIIPGACTATGPCDFTSVAPAPLVRTSNRAWYGFFSASSPNPTFTGGGLTYDFGTRTNLQGPTPNVVTGTVDIPGTSTCSPSLNGFTGNLSTYGMTNINTQLQGNATLALGGRTNDFPTGGLGVCAPGWPCDVSFDGDNLLAVAPTNSTIFANTPPAGTGEVITAMASDSFNLRLTNGSSTCPAASAVTSAGGAPTGSTWSGPNPAGCTGAGRQSCSFTAGTNPAPGVASGCAPLVSYNGVTPTGTCSSNGRTYGVGPGGTINTGSTVPVSTIVTGDASSCPASLTLTSATQSGLSWTGYLGSPMALTLAGTAPQAQEEATSNDPNAIPAGYSGAPSVSNSGLRVGVGPEETVPPACAAAGSLVTYAPGFVGRSLGLDVTGNKCPGEKDCQRCFVQPLTFTWGRPRTQCNYTAPRTTVTVDQTITYCAYNRARFNLQFTPPAQRRCRYSVPARRVDFTIVADNVCRYTTTQRTVERTVFNYTYQYLTNGTEVASRWTRDVPNENFCGTSWSGAFAAACPETLNDCAGLGAGSLCKLSWGSPRGSVSTGALADNTTHRGNGRFRNKLGVAFVNQTECSETSSGLPAPDVLRTLATPLLPWPPSSTYTPGSTAGFCQSQGAPPTAPEFKLISDWYSPATANGTAASACPNFPSGSCNPAAWTFSSSNTPRKDQGFGGKGGDVSTQPTPSPIFVPIPDDGVYDPIAQSAAIKKAMSKCVQPNASSVTGTVWTPEGGICMPAFTDNAHPQWSLFPPGSEPSADVTPLYGSLRNAGKYLTDRLDSDPESECRDYYIVLATDGRENTPRGYTTSDLTTLLADYRNRALLSPSGKNTSIRTFVIGFGTGASEEADLDAMAAAGGTTSAYKADSLTALQSALNSVFSIITTGNFSRSKPTISTDGERIYTAQYERNSSTPEWKGKLFAYGLDPTTGDPEVKWEYSNKLDGQSDATRTLKVRLDPDDTGPLPPQTYDLVEGNTIVRNKLAAATDFAGAAAGEGLSSDQFADAVVRFIRNPGLPGTKERFLRPAVSIPGKERASRAGAIVRSGVIVVGKSPYAAEWAGAGTTSRARYQSYIDTVSATRPRRVLVGANDGMVHGLYEKDPATDCTTDEASPLCPNGKEAWGFMPEEVTRDLFRTKSGNQSFVNGLVSVADVCADGTGDARNCTTAQWKTIAIPTMRDGGRHVFALDVSTGSTPSFLWEFSHPMLGFTDSSPAVGRVEYGSGDRFVAIFGGGAKVGARGSLTGNEGQSAFVVDTSDGQLLTTGPKSSAYTKFFQGPNELDVPAEMAARPSIWRRPGTAYLHSAMLPASNGSLYVMRFEKKDTDRSNHTDVRDWAPDEFFDPTSNRNRFDPNGTAAKIRRVVETPNPNPLLPPTYTLVDDGALPIAPGPYMPPPIYNRPRVASLVDPRGDLPDYFVGTGDTLDPANPRWNTNFFYAVHDRNQQPKGANNDSQPLWVAKFIGNREQVVSEPALINGAVIVATYEPPAVGSTCGLQGDTLLYAFDPKSGELTPALTFPTGSAYTGQTSVIRRRGIGIPSDLITIGNNVYYTSSASPAPQKQPVRPSIASGDVRSFRRLR